MLGRITEIKKCLSAGLYEAALALSLTLPDICGQVEYPGIGVGERYRNWVKNFVDETVWYDSIIDALVHFFDKNTDQKMEPMTPSDVYNLRCAFLHSGNADDLGDQTKIDEFILVKPGLLGQHPAGLDFGYRYKCEQQASGADKHIALFDIKYLCDMLCKFAEDYYHTRRPEEFNNHTFKLQDQLS